MSSTTRPSPLAPKSFQRYEPTQLSQTLRSPASTKQSGDGDGDGDVFEKPEVDEENDDGGEDSDDDDDDRNDEDIDDDSDDNGDAEGKNNNMNSSSNGDVKDAGHSVQDNADRSLRAAKLRRRQRKLDELPVELATLTDRFVDSLSAKVHSEPPTIESISDLFQDFYTRAESHIATHISALLSRLNRESSPGKTGTTASIRSRASQAKDAKAAQQMLTPSEVTERRKARKQLEYKRVLLEEAVEKRACEKVYDKIWRHKSTLDHVRDEKLRSKTAALALVGIDLKDLGIEVNEAGGDGDNGKTTTTLDHIQQSLAPARDALARMNDERSPLGKLQHLQAAHKAIVDTLCTIHPSGSSADEILPTLIYTLITSPVEGINIISNLYFIQRFRAASKIDGEAAYCLTNLEAAISFLENVDLASLRADEAPSGPHAQSEPEAVKELPVKAAPASRSVSAQPSSSVTTATGKNAESSSATPAKRALEATSQAPPSTRSQRTLSDLLQPITTAPAAARRTAEESIESISSTLDNSVKFVWSRLRERSANESNPSVVVPKTLHEARELVNRPLAMDEADASSDNGSLAERDEHTATATPTPSTATATAATKLSTAEDQIRNFIGGRRRAGSLRDSAANDSQRNSISSTSSQPPLPGLANTPFDTVKNFGASINNPISQIGSAFGGALRSFSTGQRSNVAATTASGPPSISSSIAAGKPLPSPHTFTATNDTATSGTTPAPSSSTILLRPPTAAQLPSIAAPGPIPRFVSLQSANELTVGDLPVLLEDYQRLARLLDNLRLMGLEEHEQHEQQHDT